MVVTCENGEAVVICWLSYGIAAAVIICESGAAVLVVKCLIGATEIM